MFGLLPIVCAFWKAYIVSSSKPYRNYWKEAEINKDILAGKWKQLRGDIKERWGKLTDNEIEQIEGRYDKFIGKIQEKYGYSEPEAEAEIKRFLN